MSKREKLYLSLCDEVDEILTRSGIRKICLKCSTDKTNRGWGKRPYYLKDNAGCCDSHIAGTFKNKCNHLGKDGCLIKSLACKLFLCNEVEMLDMIEKVGMLERWEKIEHIAWNNGFLRYRENPLREGVR